MSRLRGSTIHIELTIAGIAPEWARYVVMLPFRDGDAYDGHEPLFAANLPMAANIVLEHKLKHPEDTLVPTVMAFEPLPAVLYDWFLFLLIGAPWNAEAQASMTTPNVDLLSTLENDDEEDQ
ncbi:hypothetical protein HMPREF9702_00345 [Delftia acidovorans CCUG 15835]|nr:hypothetical protein HMPREF9702_00345 [Delftia acidovorans CCUG 15835]